MRPLVQPLRRRIRRDEYDRMVDAGLFQRERLELVRGELRPMSPIGLFHSIVVTELFRAADRAAPPELRVHSQQPFICADDSEPEPDLSVVPFDPAPRSHPTQAALVVEVADTSLAYDLGEKAALYGESDVLEYWVIDLVNEHVHVHRDRANGRWTNLATHARDARLSPLAIPGLSASLAELRTPRR